MAAAVHYAARHELAPEALVGIYDLGGGTFDATVLRRTEAGPGAGARAGFEVVGRPQGDDRLGGIDLDAAMWGHVTATLGPEAFDLGDEPAARELRALAQVRAAAVDAKEALSYDTQAVVPVTLPGVMSEVRITRAEFEEMARPALLRTIEVFRRTCDTADVAPADLDAVLLVGGSSRIPLIGQLIASELGAAFVTDAHPKLATCLGAAQAAPALAPVLTNGTATAPLAPIEPAPLAQPAEPVPSGARTTSAFAPIMPGAIAPPLPVTAPSAPPAPAAPASPASPVLPPAWAPPSPPGRGSPTGPNGPTERRRRAAPLVAAVVLVVGLVAMAAALLSMSGGDDPPDEQAGDRGAAATVETATPSSATTASSTTTAPVATTTTAAAATATTPVPDHELLLPPPRPGPGEPCNEVAVDCFDSDGDGTATVVVGFTDCVATYAEDPGVCYDFDGDGYSDGI